MAWLSEILAFLSTYSNAISLLVILGSVIIMTVFIARLSGEGLNGEFQGDLSQLPRISLVPAQAMQGVYNPFVVTVMGGSNLQDGVNLHVSSYIPSTLAVHWVVSIEHMHKAVHLAWSDYWPLAAEGSLLEPYSHYSLVLCQNETFEERVLHVDPPADTDLCEELGAPPRDKYALVVTLTATDPDDDWTDTQIASMVVVVHVSDEFCPNPSTVITQYVRTPYSQPHNLQQLYLSSEEDTESPTENTEPEGGVCVVCQTEAVARVFLPCRHVCACDACALRMLHCPMCRTPISSFFSIGENSQTDWPETGDAQDGDFENMSLFWRLNGRLNRWLGFT